LLVGFLVGKEDFWVVCVLEIFEIVLVCGGGGDLALFLFQFQHVSFVLLI